jgi:hypothetical protein
LAWLGLAWLGLAWLGLAWLGLAWTTPSVLHTQPLKMELTKGSETSANHDLTPGKYPKEYIQYSKHSETLLFDYLQANFYNELSLIQGRIINTIRLKDFKRKFLIYTKTRVKVHIIRSICIQISLIVRCYCVIRLDTLSASYLKKRVVCL